MRAALGCPALPAAAPAACRGHPALLERDWVFVCVSLTLAAGSDIQRAGDWHRVPRRKGPVSAGTCVEPAQPTWARMCGEHLPGHGWHKPPPYAGPSLIELTEGQGFAGEVLGGLHPCGPREGIPKLAALCLGWQQEPLQLAQRLQKGHGLRAMPLLPCGMLQGAGALLRGIFLLSLQKECSCRS